MTAEGFLLSACWRGKGGGVTGQRKKRKKQIIITLELDA